MRSSARKAPSELVGLHEQAHGTASCRALGNVLDRVGDKWTVMVVAVLRNGTSRFNGLQRTIPGISHRMLTLTLRGLERDGLVKRIPYPTIPPRVDYELTELGRSLIEPLEALRSWALSSQTMIEAARLAYDQEKGEWRTFDCVSCRINMYESDLTRKMRGHPSSNWIECPGYSSRTV